MVFFFDCVFLYNHGIVLFCFYVFLFDLYCSLDSSRASTPEQPTSNGVSKVLHGMTPPDLDKADSWDVETSIAGSTNDLGVGGPNVIAPVSTATLEYSEGGTTVTNLDSCAYGVPAMNNTDSSSQFQVSGQYLTNPSGFFSQRSYPHIVQTPPQHGVTQYSTGGGVIQGTGMTGSSYLYSQTGGQSGFPLVQTVRYPTSNSPSKSNSETGTTTSDQNQAGPIPDISILRQPVSPYNSPYGTTGYSTVIQQGQSGFNTTYPQQFSTVTYVASTSAPASTTTGYTPQQSGQATFQYRYGQQNNVQGGGYAYSFLNAPPPAYSPRTYITQMNSTPPPNTVAGQASTYQLTSLVPNQSVSDSGIMTSGKLMLIAVLKLYLKF